MFSLKRLGVAISVVLAATLASAASLKGAAQNDILTADPHSQNHATTNAILMHTYEGLTRYNAKYEVEPANGPTFPRLKCVSTCARV
jgi:peptide/nickel transport system substrate-binding protein